LLDEKRSKLPEVGEYMGRDILIVQKDFVPFDTDDARKIVASALDIDHDLERWSIHHRQLNHKFSPEQTVTFSVGGLLGEIGTKSIGVLYKAYTPELMMLLCRFHRMGLHIFDMEIAEWLNSPAREKPLGERSQS
jgi:hypothetical protein